MVCCVTLEPHLLNLWDQGVEEARTRELEEDEELRSYDVAALSRYKALNMINCIRFMLENDSTVSERTDLTPDQIVRLAEVCLKQYFLYSGDFYEQLHGAGGGGHLYFKVDIIRVKRLSKTTLNTYFSKCENIP